MNTQQTQQNHFATEQKAKSTREILSQLVDLVGSEEDTHEEEKSQDEETHDASAMEEQKDFLEAEVTAMKQTLADLQGLEQQQAQTGKSQLHIFQSMASIVDHNYEYDSEEEYDSSDDESEAEEEEEFDLSDLRASQQIDDIRANAVLLLGRADELHAQVTTLKETKRELQTQLVAASRRFLQTEMAFVDDESEDEVEESAPNDQQTHQQEHQAEESEEEIVVASDSIPTAVVLPCSVTETATSTNADTSSNTDSSVLVASSAWVVPSESQSSTVTTSGTKKNSRAGLSRQVGSTAIIATGNNRNVVRNSKTPALPTTKNNARLARMKKKRVAIQRVSTISGGVAGALVLGPIGIVAGAAVGHFSAKAAGRARERHCQRKLIKDQEAQNRLEQTALSTLREVSEEGNADETKEKLPVATPVFA